MRPGKAPGAAFEAAANASPASARKPVTQGPVDADPEQEEERDINERLEDGQRARLRSEREHDCERAEHDGQHHDSEHHQEPEKQLLACASVLQRLAVEPNGRPDAAADLGLAPEMVDAEGQNPEDEVDEAQPNQPRLLLPRQSERLCARACWRGPKSNLLASHAFLPCGDGQVLTIFWRFAPALATMGRTRRKRCSSAATLGTCRADRVGLSLEARGCDIGRRHYDGQRRNADSVKTRPALGKARNCEQSCGRLWLLCHHLPLWGHKAWTKSIIVECWVVVVGSADRRQTRSKTPVLASWGGLAWTHACASGDGGLRFDGT